MNEVSGAGYAAVGANECGSTVTFTYPPYRDYTTSSTTVYPLNVKVSPPMKMNGKEYLVFEKGNATPRVVCDSLEEAQEEAEDLAAAEVGKFFVYKAVLVVREAPENIEVEEID